MTLGPTFDAVLSAARIGEEWAWTALYRDVAPNLLRYLKAKGASDPENILGDVFVQVVRKLPEFQGGESAFRAWLYTIAHNRLLDEIRARRRHPTEPLPLVWPVSPASEDSSQNDATAETHAHLKELLARLTAEQSEVLFLRVLAGLSLEETAEVLGKTTGSIKRLQARGLRSLRRIVGAGVVSFP